MKIAITTSPSQDDVAFVASQVRGHNAQFMVMGFASIAAFLRADDDRIIGGVTGKAYWDWLHIEFLWVSSEVRGRGHARSLMNNIEAEAKNQGCKYVTLDTFSFQARGFYEKIGYEVFGKLENYAGKNERYYLRKAL